MSVIIGRVTRTQFCDFSLRRYGKRCHGHINTRIYFHWNKHNEDLGNQSFSNNVQQSWKVKGLFIKDVTQILTSSFIVTLCSNETILCKKLLEKYFSPHVYEVIYWRALINTAETFTCFVVDIIFLFNFLILVYLTIRAGVYGELCYLPDKSQLVSFQALIRLNIESFVSLSTIFASANSQNRKYQIRE